jgi:hypothetical protein
MIQRLRTLLLIAANTIAAGWAFQSSSSTDAGQLARDPVAWVAEALKRMETIKPGMTRDALMKIFTSEGGVSTGLRRTFVSRDCPYFKVDVDFQAVGRPDRDHDGRVTLVEDSRDIIVSVSRPYLQFSIRD